MLAFAISLLGRKNIGLFSIARIPGSVLANLTELQFLSFNSIQFVLWLGNLLFWALVAYGCVRLFVISLRKNTGVTKPRLFEFLWLAPITLFVFAIFAVAIRFRPSLYEAILAKPAETIWSPYFLSQSDTVAFANVLLWSLLVFA